MSPIEMPVRTLSIRAHGGRLLMLNRAGLGTAPSSLIEVLRVNSSLTSAEGLSLLQSLHMFNKGIGGFFK